MKIVESEDITDGKKLLIVSGVFMYFDENDEKFSETSQ